MNTSFELMNFSEQLVLIWTAATLVSVMWVGMAMGFRVLRSMNVLPERTYVTVLVVSILFRPFKYPSLQINFELSGY